MEYDSDGQVRSYQDLSQITKNSVQKERKKERQIRKTQKWSHWKVNKQILEESKLGRRIRRGWVFHHYKFYPEGRPKLAPHSMPQTLIQNSLSGPKNWQMEFRAIAGPETLRGWGEGCEPERESWIPFINSAQDSELGHIWRDQTPVPQLKAK